jgi:hypothetical protein
LDGANQPDLGAKEKMLQYYGTVTRRATNAALMSNRKPVTNTAAMGKDLNSRRKIMSKRVATIFAVRFAAVVIILSGYDTWARADDDLPPSVYPEQAEPGDWAADFNEALIACYNGSMSTCDSIWLSKRVLIDTYLWQYGRTCGGRVDLDALRSAGAFRLGGPDMHCTDIFPGHE